MMIKADFHTHSSFSGDCKTPMDIQIEKAIEIGLEHLCLTDHLDLDYPEKYGYFDLDTESYVDHVLLMKEKYKDKINIYLGIEFGLVGELDIAKRYEGIVKRHPFDFIIGSIHLIDWQDPYFPDYWQGKSIHQGMVEYFDSILESIKIFKDYNSLGHLDYVLRYTDLPDNDRRGKYLLFNNYSYKEYEEVLDEILRHLIKNDKALEVNTAGYKAGLGAPNPQHSVLERYKEMGGKLITIGSDGHQPDHLAYDFDKIRNLLLEVGYDRYYIYKEGSPIGMDL